MCVFVAVCVWVQVTSEARAICSPWGWCYRRLWVTWYWTQDSWRSSTTPTLSQWAVLSPAFSNKQTNRPCCAELRLTVNFCFCFFSPLELRLLVYVPRSTCQPCTWKANALPLPYTPQALYLFLFVCFVFETESCFVVLSSLRFMAVLLPQLPQYWDCRWEPSLLASTYVLCLTYPWLALNWLRS